VDWGLYACEYIMLLSILAAFILILFHTHRPAIKLPFSGQLFSKCRIQTVLSLELRENELITEAHA
jgi:hypothetical protein